MTQDDSNKNIPSPPTPEELVNIRRQWNDSRRTATIALGSLGGVHWSLVSGGVRALAPQPFLHGYISCDSVLEGELAHSCRHGRGPHSIKVCIVKKDNSPEVFRKLVELAGPKPKLKPRLR